MVILFLILWAPVKFCHTSKKKDSVGLLDFVGPLEI